MVDLASDLETGMTDVGGGCCCGLEFMLRSWLTRGVSNAAIQVCVNHKIDHHANCQKLSQGNYERLDSYHGNRYVV